MSSRDISTSAALAHRPGSGPAPAQLADVLERVLDKGIVIAGDIQINLLDIELLTIRLRLLVASADKAREMGIDWWRGDPFLTGGHSGNGGNRALEGRLRRLESAVGVESEDKE
jgi:hypothetical protein